MLIAFKFVAGQTAPGETEHSEQRERRDRRRARIAGEFPRIDPD